MCRIINSYEFGNINANYIENDYGRAILILTPKNSECDLLSEKNREAYNNFSIAHLKLKNHNMGFFSNTMKLSETVDRLKYTKQTIAEDEKSVTVVTEENSKEGYGIRHCLKWYRGERGFEVYTEFFNNGSADVELQYLTSASMDALSPFLADEGSTDMIFHRFKASWSLEGLHQENNLCELGLEQAWNTSGECLKLGAIGSRAVREYHPYGAVEDRKNNITWGVYLAHNASWQLELSRVETSVSLSIGIADALTGAWSKKVGNGMTFKSPKAMISVVNGGIAELSNSILSMRHRAINAYGEVEMAITYNDYVTTWGHPTEKSLVAMSDILKQGKTKYLVMDAGWFDYVGDWNVDIEAFPHGMKYYCDEIRKRDMIPGIWMEYENIGKDADMFGEKYDFMKLKIGGRVIVGKVINGAHAKFFDFRKKEVIDYLDRKVINFLRENGFGYLKIDYNANIGIGIDGNESPGENLRQHMEAVRNFVIKLKREIPDIVIENCASGGCRLEPSMMDITAMSSASDTHEVYEAAIVAANLHYLTPPRQNQIWSTLKPEYSKERFSYAISQGFLGRLCWSGAIDRLSEEQLKEMFAAEEFYLKVAPIIKEGDSYIYRTSPCCFRNPIGTQAVVRYSKNMGKALIVVHSFKDMHPIEVELKGKYVIEDSLYEKEAIISDSVFEVSNMCDFSGNVYLLNRI